VKLSWKENQELSALPDRIQALETEQASISEQLADVNLYTNNPEQITDLQKRFEAIDAELVDALGRWETLEAKAKS
jgi:hypothetical protein